MRELRMELRRSSAPMTALGTVLILGLLLKSRPTWEDGWPDLSTSVRGFLVLLLPLVLAAGAWQGSRERRARTEELMTTTPRPPWQRALPPTSAVAAAVVLTVLIVQIAVTAANGTGNWMHQSWPLTVAAVGLLALAAAAALGAGLGRLIRSNLTAPLLMIATLFALVLVYGRWSTNWAPLLNPVLKTRQNAGDLLADTEQVRSCVSAGQAIWLLGLLAGGLILAGATHWRSRLIAILPMLAGLALAAPFLASSSGGGAYGVDPVANRQFCAPGTPAVCGAIAHRDAVLRAAAPARRVLAALAQLPDSPTRAVESSQFPADRPIPDDVLAMSAVDLTSPRTTAASMISDLAVGLGVPAVCDVENEAAARRYYDAQYLTGAWLMKQPNTGSYGDNNELDAQLTAFYALPKAEQLRRIIAARADFRSCSPDALAHLTASISTRKVTS